MQSAIACVRRSRAGASAFARDFDAELTRAYLLFQIDPLGGAEDLPTSFAARYDRWHATSKYPRLIKNFYLFTSDGDDPLQKFDPSTRSSRCRSNGPRRCRTGGTTCIDTMAEPRQAPEAAITSSAGSDRRFGSRCRRSSCRHRCCRQATPAAGSRHAFGAARRLHDSGNRRELRVARDAAGARRAALHAEQRRRCAVGGGQPPAGGRVIYHSSETFNPAPGTHADATADLFAIRTQDFGRVASEIHRFVAFAATQRLRSEKAAAAGSTGRRAGQPASRSSSSEPSPALRLDRPGTGADDDRGADEGHADVTELAVDPRAPVRLARGGSGGRPAAQPARELQHPRCSRRQHGAAASGDAPRAAAGAAADGVRRDGVARAPDAAGGHPIRRREPRRRHRRGRVAGAEVR